MLQQIGTLPFGLLHCTWSLCSQSQPDNTNTDSNLERTGPYQTENDQNHGGSTKYIENSCSSPLLFALLRAFRQCVRWSSPDEIRLAKKSDGLKKANKVTSKIFWRPCLLISFLVKVHPWQNCSEQHPIQIPRVWHPSLASKMLHVHLLGHSLDGRTLDM